MRAFLVLPVALAFGVRQPSVQRNLRRKLPFAPPLGSHLHGTLDEAPGSDEGELLEAIQRAHALEIARIRAGKALGRPLSASEWAESVNLTDQELRDVHQQGLRAREALCGMHLNLVRAEVARLAFRSQVNIPFEDLVQEGLLGLTRAMEGFDLSRTGTIKFSSYAVFWIKEALQRATMKHSRLIRVPISRLRLWRKVQNVQRDLEQRLGRAPNVTEVAHAMAMTPEAIGKVQEAVSRRVWSLDDATAARPGADECEIPADQFDVHFEVEQEPEAVVEHAEMIDLVRRILPMKELNVVMLKFGPSLDGPPRSNIAVAEILGTYPDTVRLRLKRAMQRLRQEVEKEGVDEDALTEANRRASDGMDDEAPSWAYA
eukprot:scaffold301_cov243-Pinguiococcus_pyrenoidosus.AAC.123